MAGGRTQGREKKDLSIRRLARRSSHGAWDYRLAEVAELQLRDGTSCQERAFGLLTLNMESPQGVMFAGEQ